MSYVFSDPANQTIAIGVLTGILAFGVWAGHRFSAMGRTRRGANTCTDNGARAEQDEMELEPLATDDYG